MYSSRDLKHLNTAPIREPHSLPTARTNFRLHVKQVEKSILSFSQAREWEPFYTPRNVAMCIAAEIGELSELWRYTFDCDKESPRCCWCGTKQNALADELADIVIYIFHMARICNICI